MITSAQMYWLTRLDSIRRLCTTVSVTIILVTVATFMMGAMGCNSSAEFKKFTTGLLVLAVRIALPIVVITTLCVTFTPSTREMAAIMIVPKIANNEKVCDVGNRLYDLAVEWMDELRPGKKKSK